MGLYKNPNVNPLHYSCFLCFLPIIIMEILKFGVLILFFLYTNGDHSLVFSCVGPTCCVNILGYGQRSGTRKEAEPRRLT